MTDYLTRAGKPSLAYVYKKGEAKDLPTVMFCGGYRSDMEGTKALFLQDQCAAIGQGYLRFDYTGHGHSQGVFEDCTISDWRDDALDIFKALIDGPVIIVGSSMGGWIALLLALALKESGHVKGVIGLAAAPDFTEDMFARLTPPQQKELMDQGVLYVPNDYSDIPYTYTKALYEDGKTNLLLTRSQNLNAPLHLIQGQKDIDVPPQTAARIAEVFGLAESDVTYIDDGDHRLSSPDQLAVLWGVVEGLG